MGGLGHMAVKFGKAFGMEVGGQTSYWGGGGGGGCRGGPQIGTQEQLPEAMTCWNNAAETTRVRRWRGGEERR